LNGTITSIGIDMTQSRRSFLRTTGAALLTLAGSPAVVLASRRRADTIIRGGTVFDGTGAAGIESDIAISGGRISAIARRITESAALEIDARGLAVAPGFIDIHSHADGSLFEDPRAESVIRQGITTIVGGQDGSSRVPSSGRGGSSESFAALFARFDGASSAVNVASMVGLGTVRGYVVGNADRPATPEELRRMTALVERAIAEGACGASSGLEYTPGGFATRDELIALCRPLASRRLPYATHMRNEDDRLLDSIDESIAVARGAGCPLQISHLKTQGPRNWGKLDDVFARVESASRAGLDIAFDRYPYIAYQTGLTNLFPIWSREGGTAAFLARVDAAETRARVRDETLAKVALIGGWDNVMIANVSHAPDERAEGARLGTYAASQSIDPYEMAVGLLRRSNGSVGMVGFAMSEENLDRILAHPRGMVCSDGGAYAVSASPRTSHPHPRGLGSFPRVIARYVRERKVLTLPQAINKMTALPASRLRITDRGRLAPGLAADVLVFDPATIADRATFEEPFQYPVGIKAVLVNGAPALLDGARDAAPAGRSVRPAV
jgi:N-acyl-D-amino-acid deacylase